MSVYIRVSNCNDLLIFILEVQHKSNETEEAGREGTCHCFLLLQPGHFSKIPHFLEGGPFRFLQAGTPLDENAPFWHLLFPNVRCDVSLSSG